MNYGEYVNRLKELEKYANSLLDEVDIDEDDFQYFFIYNDEIKSDLIDENLTVSERKQFESLPDLCVESFVQNLITSFFSLFNKDYALNQMKNKTMKTIDCYQKVIQYFESRQLKKLS